MWSRSRGQFVENEQFILFQHWGLGASSNVGNNPKNMSLTVIRISEREANMHNQIDIPTPNNGNLTSRAALSAKSVALRPRSMPLAVVCLLNFFRTVFGLSFVGTRSNDSHLVVLLLRHNFDRTHAVLVQPESCGFTSTARTHRSTR
jgi:hypothetical protein